MKELKVAINEGFYWEMNKISKEGDKKKKMGESYIKEGIRSFCPLC